MSWAVTSDLDKFDEASAWFASRVPYTKADYDALDDKARKQAFWLSSNLELDGVQTIFDELKHSIDNGTPFEEFKKRVGDKLGALGPKGYHIETVYRNWVQTSYNTGRWYQLQDADMVRLRPYYMFDATLDARTCFAAGTLVTMASGEQRPIDQIRPGDLVLSSRGRPRRVVATVATPKRTWGTVRFADGKSFRVTPNHPILTTNGWIRAKDLRPGDEAIVQSEALQGLWSYVPTGPCDESLLQLGLLSDEANISAVQELRCPVLPAASFDQGVLRARMPEGVSSAKGLSTAHRAVQGVRQALHENDRHSEVLRPRLRPILVEASDVFWLQNAVCSNRSNDLVQRRVQRRCARRAKDKSLQGLRKALSTGPREQDLLHPRVRENARDVRVVSKTVRVPHDLRQSRSVPVLLGCMQAHEPSPWSPAGGHQADMSSLWRNVSGRPEAGGREAVVLLEGMSEGAAGKVHSLREDGREAGKRSVLLGELLSQTHGRDASGRSCQEVASTSSNPVRAGGAGAPVVPGLPRGGQDLCGGGRFLLARGSEGESTGRQARPRADSHGIHGHQAGRENHPEGPGLRDPRAISIWPIPGAAVATAPSAAIASIHWELTEDPEPAYDIQVEDDAGFIAEGVVVHNSKICKHCDGIIKRHNDPFWDNHVPPLHHRCRSSVRSLRRGEALARGITQDVPEGTTPQGDFGKAPPLRGDLDHLEPQQSRFAPEVWEEFKKRQAVMLEELEAANKQALTDRLIRDRQDPQHWFETEYQAKYGDEAGRAVAWGRAMEHKGLELSPKKALAEHRRLVRAGAQEAPDFDGSIRAVLRAQGIAERDLDGALNTTVLRELADFADANDLVIESANIRGAATLVGHATSIERKKGAAEFFNIIATAQGSHTQKQLEDAAAKMTRFYDAFADGSVKHPQKITLQVVPEANLGDRGGYLFGHNMIDPGSAELRTLVHEWAHGLDEADPAVASRALAFRRIRTLGNVKTDLAEELKSEAYADELCWRDAFYTPYMGKEYDGNLADITEITTMAIESIVRMDPGEMVLSDPDTLYFALGQLAGSRLP